MGIVSAILALMFLIIMHELGHFAAAKACGVKVNEFSVFFGPAIHTWQGKETKYSLRCIPLGGYCAMEGEDDDSTNPRAFCAAPLWKRAVIVAAGPFMNLVIAFVAMSIVMCSCQFMTNTVDYLAPNGAAQTAGIQQGDVITAIDGKAVYFGNDLDILTYGRTPETVDITYSHQGEIRTVTLTPNFERYMMNITVSGVSGQESLTVNTVIEGGAADKAGIKAGDVITAINGTLLVGKNDLDTALADSRGEPIAVTVTRDGETLELELTPQKAIQDIGSAIGIYSFEYRARDITNCVQDSFGYFVSTSRSIFLSFVWLFNGTVSVTEVSGPVGIVTTISSAIDATESFGEKMINLTTIASMISINLGLFNLLPLPALDGCKLLFIACMAVTRKKIPAKVEGIISAVGLVLLLIVMILVSAHDIWRLFGNG